jgi:uncharacterized protein with GYD domain
MTTFIFLLNYTQKGIENIKEGPVRLDNTKKLFKSMGAELKEYFLVTGRFDAVVVAEAPNDETIAKLALSIASLGAIRIETLSAYTEKEYRKIISTLT